MAVTEKETDTDENILHRKLSLSAGVGPAILASAAVFGVLALRGNLHWGAAGAGFAVVAGITVGSVLLKKSARVMIRRPVETAAGRPVSFRDDVAAEILDELPDPVFVVDQGGRLVMCNEAALPLLGRQAIGKHLAAVLRSARLIAAVDEVWRTGEPREIDYRQLGPVEREFHVFVSPLSLATAQSGVSAGRPVLVRLHDQTAARRLEEMRVDFVANASHELKTPLASLSGFIDTLRGHARDDPAAQARFLEIMADQAGRMRRLIEDLLSLSRIELNEHVRPVGAVNMVKLLADSVAALEPIAVGNGVEIEIMPVALPAGAYEVRGDRDELSQLLQNLIDNALRYGRSGKRVEVSLSIVKKPRGPMVRLAVRDYGPGIAPEHLPRLTERFYRVDATLSRARGGTGLGLAIVKHIINRHEGVLNIESTLGEGTTFSVALPASEGADLSGMTGNNEVTDPPREELSPKP